MFTRKKDDSFVELLVYVDEVLLASSDLDVAQSIKSSLNAHFKLKGLGLVKYFLKMDIAQSKKGISLCHRKYTLEIISDAGLLGCKPVNFPMDSHCKLSNNDGKFLEDVSCYKRLIVKLLYLTNSRPYIIYPVYYSSQLLDSPRAPCMQATLRILKYIKLALGQDLFFSTSSPIHLKAFANSNWASYKEIHI